MKTYDRIIQASLELFNEHGERAITTNHIAAHLGISPGNLYYHFRNKEEIIYQIFLQYKQFMENRLSVPTDRPIMVEDMIVYLDTAFIGMWRYRFMFHDLAGLLGRNEKFAEAYQKFIREDIIAILTALFGEFSSIGLLATDAEEIESLVVNCWLIIKFWYAFQQTQNPMGKLTEEMGRRGVRQVLALFKPHIQPMFRPLFAEIQARYHA
ncbi:AcrR family transcriptional regulator [Chitinivorax tropicus]|uniref:AcrR family transcriptional regulator n=1 Tax=Chitinivorax tropicus TaxID=714531 RepID=A0A840MQT6_9PROT|nr:TetR/AcrR family transcriptional regulator [Chitinivorax tropicus]MBB5017601.1 AcrR family transcriptional regulator [Chitinivorax tropicus]